MIGSRFSQGAARGAIQLALRAGSSTPMPGWFRVTSRSENGSTVITIEHRLRPGEGDITSSSKTIDDDRPTLMRVAQEFPAIEKYLGGILASLASKVIMPKYIEVLGAPSPEAQEGREVARLSIEADILGMRKHWHQDASADRLYLRDMIVFYDLIQALMEAKRNEDQVND